MVANAEVTSSNTVGFNKGTTVANDVIYQVFSFESVGGTDATYTLGQISVGTEDFAWYNNDYIATVNEYGAQDQYFTWDPDANEGKGGWFECDENQTIDYDAAADDIVMPLNKAIFVFSANGAELTYSGQVMTGDTEIYAVANDVTFSGNFTPATITLGDIVVGSEDFAWYNNDYLSTIDPYGAQDQYYTYDPDANAGAGGWFECDENQTVDYDAPADNIQFPANQAFIFFTANGASINIPSPL